MEVTNKSSRTNKAVKFLPIAFICFVFIQSLFFKFSGADESIHIFQTLEDWLGLSFFEPTMRIAVGVAELIATILLLTPKTRFLGALLSFFVMSGAIFFHVFSPLGIEVHNDNGTLFIMAILVFISSIIIMVNSRNPLTKKTKTS